jgi:hypothetical protein
LNKWFPIGQKKTLYIPSGNCPLSKRCAAVNERRNTNGFSGNAHIRRNHRHSIARSCQRDQRLRGSALQKHLRRDLGDLTGRVKPRTRCKSAAEQQQRLVRQFDDIKDSPAGLGMVRRQDRYQLHWKQSARSEPIIARWDDREAHVATRKTVRQPSPSVLHEMDVHAGMASAM